MNTAEKIIIAFILFLCLVTRFPGLGYSPPHLSNDEISIAWDAYSLSTTMRDEHNVFLPLSFRSHNTYKAPLTVYLGVLPVMLMGPGDYAARLPSAIFGLLTIPIMMALVRLLGGSRFMALTGGMLLALTPWHIYSSRVALESNIALFFVAFGLFGFLIAIHKKNSVIALTISMVSFALSVYAYHTQWIFTPLLLAVLWLYFHRRTFTRPEYYLGAVLFLLLVSPIFTDYIKNKGTYARANTEIFTHEPGLDRQLKNPGIMPFQKFLLVAMSITGNYSSYTNPGYLFFDGLNLLPRGDPYQSGLFLWPFLIFLSVGLFRLPRMFPRHSTFIYIWAALSPLVPSLTLNAPNQVRNLVSLLPYTIIITAGVAILWKKYPTRFLYRAVMATLIFVSLFYFCAVYYYHFPRQSAQNFQYGYKQMAGFISIHYQDYEKIIIDPRFGDANVYSGVPHLYIPYYTRMDPRKMLVRVENSRGLFFDKYEFRDINWNSETPAPNRLYIVPRDNPPPPGILRAVHEVTLPDSKTALKAFAYQ